MKQLTRDQMKNVNGGGDEEAQSAGGFCTYVGWPCTGPGVNGNAYCKCFAGTAW